MTDRELLELAAKALGIEVWTDVDGNLYTCMQDLLETPWNPLNDDADALRLAVRLNLFLGPEFSHYLSLERFAHQNQDDAFATRRAIVRAAAKISRNME